MLYIFDLVPLDEALRWRVRVRVGVGLDRVFLETSPIERASLGLCRVRVRVRIGLCF